MIPCKELTGQSIVPVYPWCPSIIFCGVCRASLYRAPRWVGSAGTEHKQNNMATQTPKLTTANESRKRGRLETSPATEGTSEADLHDSNMSLTEDSTDQRCHAVHLPSEVFWPRFLVIESTATSRPLSSLSPFVIEKTMKGIAGEVKSVKKLRSGLILVEVTRPGQARNLLRQTLFASIPVKVSEHRSLNSCKGVIRSFDLAAMEPEDLKNELSSQGVTAVRNIKQKRNGTLRNTPAIVLTFASSELPGSIKAGYLCVKVDPFIPNPLRCFSCQAFGHHQSTCKRTKICPKCSLAAHGDDPCNGPIKCVNCGADHPTYASSCPRWIQEKDICRTKVTNNITFPEARRIVLTGAHTAAPIARPSYASVVKSSRSIGVQTDITQCRCVPSLPPDSDCAEVSAATQTDNHSTNSAGEQQQKRINYQTKQGRTNKSAIVASPNTKQRGGSLSPEPNSGHTKPRTTSVDLTGGGAEWIKKADRRRAGYHAPRQKINLP
jgi:hypothetical protein